MDVALAAMAQGKNIGFEKLEEETSRITFEVAELSRFIRLNYSAFMKVHLHRLTFANLDLR
jgi:SPX domain protein involved in polyphosphate accumulation